MDEIVATLNHFSAKKTWKNSDIDGTHRIGQLDKNSDAPRQLIVTFCQADDKLSILRDRNLRDGLRRERIRVSTDLTPRQREQVQHLKSQGKVAYFRNGKLHVENSSTSCDD